MSRRNNKKRRSERRERKEALEQARVAFDKKYPERGTVPNALHLNIIASACGREVASAKLREATSPLNFEYRLMCKKAELRREFFRNNKWREGVESLDEQGWA